MASDLSQFGGLPLQFEHNGKVYAVQLLKQNAKGAFERWVKRQAWKTLEDISEFLPPDELEQRKEALLKRQQLGYYGYHGPLCQEAQSTPAGMLALASILFGCSEDEMIEIAATRSDEIKELIRQVLKESAPSKVSEESVPNA